MYWEEKPLLTITSLSLVSNKEIIYVKEKINLYKSSNLYKAPISDKIGILTGFETITTEENCGGFCDVSKKQIAIVEKDEGTILHECMHAFQFDMGLFDKLQPIFSDQLKLEQHCNTLARIMHFELHKTDSIVFNSYFNEEDKIWLKKWYNGFFEEDI
jgi:hypothetical protein